MSSTVRLLAALGGLGFLLTATAVEARPWQGITPGESTIDNVKKSFGTPHRALGKRGKCAQLYNYQAEKALEGAKQANVCFDAKGIVIEIAVFPDRDLSRELVIEAYGESYKKRLTDQFREYFVYRGQGLAIFFGKDAQTVHSILFTPPAKKKK